MRPANIKTRHNATRPPNFGAADKIVDQVRHLLSQHDLFRYQLDFLFFDYQNGRLIITGRLPSFYLKQVLQTVLSTHPEIQQIDNRIDVVSCHGVSSVPHPLNGNTKP